MVLTTDSNGIQIKRYAGKVVVHKIPSTLTGDVILPPDITHIQKTSFVGCNNITSLTIQDHVKAINTGAFDHCTNLEKIIVTRDNKCFESDHKGVLFTKGREWLVYAPPKLSGLYIVPNGVKHIDKYAFKNCANMTTLMLAQTVATIDEGAFENCTGLMHMIIPKNVTHIKSGAFVGCSQLCGVTVASDNDSFASEDGALFNKDKTELLYVPATFVGQQGKKDGRFMIPEGVVNVADYACSGCVGIRELVLPESIYWIAPHAFEGCDRLMCVYAPIGFVDWDWFEDCESVQKCFYRDPLGLIYDRDTMKISMVGKEIVCANIMRGIEEIEAKTFVNCKLLSQVTIPETVTMIGEYPFVGCKNLTKFNVTPQNPVFFTDGHGVLFYKANHSNIVLVRAPITLCGVYRIPDGVTHIAGGAFESCAGLTEIVAPSSVRAIAKWAFIDCADLLRLTLPTGNATFSAGITEKCPKLTVYAPVNSWSEKCAKQYKIPFQAE